MYFKSEMFRSAILECSAFGKVYESIKNTSLQ